MNKGNELDPAFLNFRKEAANRLNTETLETRGNDQLDFLDVHVEQIVDLLEKAYELGRTVEHFDQGPDLPELEEQTEPDEFEDMEANGPDGPNSKYDWPEDPDDDAYHLEEMR